MFEPAIPSRSARRATWPCATSRAFAAVATFLALAGCGDSGPSAPAATDTTSGLGDVVVGAQQYIEFPACPTEPAGGWPDPVPDVGTENICPVVNLELLACSAAIDCRDGFLRDPATQVPSHTLTTSLTCGFNTFPDPSDPPDPPDPGLPDPFETLPTFMTRVRCDDGNGDFSIEPPPPDFAEHRFYAQATNGMGDVFLNTARLTGPIADNQGNDCQIEAWSSLWFQRLPPPPAEREARVDRWAPIVRWQAELAHAADHMSCNMLDVDAEVSVAVVHDRPMGPAFNTYPAEFVALLLRMTTRFDLSDGRPYNALHGIASDVMRFPPPPNSAPPTFVEHAFTVPLPERPEVPTALHYHPASIDIRRVCAETDAGGFITHVGVSFTFVEAPTLPPGILIIRHDAPGGPSWSCEPETAADGTEVCVLYGKTYNDDWVNEVPCLESGY
jgi:hypothetical protein